MKNLHLLPTNNLSKLYKENGEFHFEEYPLETVNAGNQYIYITSNEEIKEGIDQWYLDKVLNEPYNSGGAQYSLKQDVIILTTDQDLIADGVQAIDDTFLEWFVKNPSCEEVKTKLVEFEVDMGLGDSCIEYGSYYKIFIPQKEPKQETLEEAAERILANNIDGLKDALQDDDLFFFYKDVIQCYGESMAKWQADKMYSEEDMRNAFDSAREFNSLDGVVDVHIVLPMGGDMSDLQPLHFTFDEWFKQFKKK
jgi:hypothetical protein